MRTSARAGYLLLAALILGCGAPKTAEEIWNAATNDINKRDYPGAIKLLGKLATKFPDSPLASQALFRLGDVYMNRTNQVELAIETFQDTFDRYPDSDEGVKSLFMIGFVNANYLDDLGAAEQAYNRFLEKYPNHELGESVRFELKNLGRPVEEIEELKDVVNVD